MISSRSQIPDKLAKLGGDQKTKSRIRRRPWFK